MIEVKNVEKSFMDGDERRQILFGINAKFYDGKVNLIIGQSGSGKTVLVKNLVGLFKPDSGEILYDGRDITKLEDKQMKELRKEIRILCRQSYGFDRIAMASIEQRTMLANRLWSTKRTYSISVLSRISLLPKDYLEGLFGIS